MIRLLFVAALLGAPAAVSAQSAEPAAPAEQAAADAPIVVEGEKEKKICRTESSTGSIMPRRVCRTASEVARQQEEAQRQLDLARSERRARDLVQFERQNLQIERRNP